MDRLCVSPGCDILGKRMKPRIEHLYIHIPFCAKICPYCAFYVLKGGIAAQDRFVDALVREIEMARHEFDWDLKTIYCGGGTPSVLPSRLFEKLACALAGHRAIEFTLEANPATVTEGKAEAWLHAGVNRISLGAQSFDPEFLKILGRQHHPEEIGETMQFLRESGFNNINIDLMFALPDQPLETWRNTLSQALACQPDHISAYALTYEEDTPFLEKLRSGEWKIDEEREIAMFEETVQRLTGAGLPPYEISNFAKPGFESHHNRAYWRGADYLGIGPSAVSTMGNRRWKNVADIGQYATALEKGTVLRTEEEIVDAVIRQKERIMFGLRTREGISIEEVSLQKAESERLIEEGLAEIQSNRLILTRRGRLLADSVAEIFA